MSDRKPNILFVFTDQFRADALGAESPYAKTPHLDALAAEGTLFRRAYCNSPECIPSRFSFALSQYPHETGVWRNGWKHPLDPSLPNWMRAVASAGYRTSLFGKSHLHPHNADLRQREGLMRELGVQDLDEIPGPRSSAKILSHMTAEWEANGLWEGYRRDLEERYSTKPYMVRPTPLPFDQYYDVYVGRKASQYLRAYDDSKPWCCWVSFAGPHEPWDTPEPFASLFAPEDAPPPLPRMPEAGSVGGLTRKALDSPKNNPAGFSESDVRAMRANYAGAVALIDAQIGAVLDVVCARGEIDNTIVIFASDHGEMNGDQGLIYKSTFLEPAIRIPLIVRLPPPWSGPPGIVSDKLVELVDIAATLVDFAGGSIPDTFRGRSLQGEVNGEGGDERTVVLIEYDHHYCLVQDRWKAEFAPDKSVVTLFDMKNDPGEQTNLAASTQCDEPSWQRLLAQALRDGAVAGAPQAAMSKAASLGPQ